MTIAKFIVDRAVYLALQDKQFQPKIDSGYADEALINLNLLLDEWRYYIPFHEEITFNDVDNLEASTFVEVDDVIYIINTTTFPLVPVNLTRFKEVQVIEGLTGFPQYYYFDLMTQNIEVYPKPSNPTYQFKVWGRVQQINLGLNDTIPANMPSFMQTALIYEIAYRLAGQYGMPWDDKNENTRVSTYQSLKAKKDFDLTPRRQIDYPRSRAGSNAPFPWFYYISGGT